MADAIAALEQARAQKPFQLLNLGGERWLREMKFACGPGQMHFIGHSQERTKPSELDHCGRTMIEINDHGNRIIRFLNDGWIVNRWLKRKRKIIYGNSNHRGG
jgi:hypothetical protein